MTRQLHLRALVLTIAAASCATTSQIVAQRTASDSVAVEVAGRSFLTEGTQRFPAIEGPSAPGVSINSTLAEYDMVVMRAAKECNDNLRETKIGSAKASWTRTVKVTMRGPHYISYLATDNYYCGGAYPDAGAFALVFDLQSGKVVDWVKLLPSATSQTQMNADGSESKTISSPLLTAMYLRKLIPQLDKDCADAIRGENFNSGFSLWPDAKGGGLIVHPNLNHAIAACGEDVSLSVEEQRSLGVSDEMIGAIKAAHTEVKHSHH